MTPTELESVYEALATTIDQVGESKTELFLAKLTLLLAERVGDTPTVLRSIRDSARSL
ncbi:MAG: hypothetical protein QNJ94_11085 [Alphaproteobacteria bacterium]|nr:hypothetical protein [Alphaproteobacteria bacterium]